MGRNANPCRGLSLVIEDCIQVDVRLQSKHMFSILFSIAVLTLAIVTDHYLRAPQRLLEALNRQRALSMPTYRNDDRGAQFWPRQATPTAGPSHPGPGFHLHFHRGGTTGAAGTVPPTLQLPPPEFLVPPPPPAIPDEQPSIRSSPSSWPQLTPPF